MGKGDKRSRRGKIFAGSHGKTRPKKKSESVDNPEGPASKAVREVFSEHTFKAKKAAPKKIERIEATATATSKSPAIENQPSEESRQRVLELLEREKANAISVEEKSELDYYMHLEHLMRIAKTRVYDQLMDD